jgi:hypothetical protein
MGIMDMTVEVLAKANVHEEAPPQEAGMEGRDNTATQDGGGLKASQHAGAMQDGAPEKRQLLQQKQKPKPKLQLTLQPEPQHEPKPKLQPTPMLARRCDTFQPPTQTQKAPDSPGPTLTTGLSMAGDEAQS